MKKTLVAIIMCTIIFQSVLGLTISPSELRIKNTDLNKNYKFIVLVSNPDNTVIDVEIKSSDKAVSISPNKFILGEGDKKSINIGFSAKNIDPSKNKILIQPNINNIPSESRLMIYLEEGTESASINEELKENKSIITIIKEPKVLQYIIIGLASIVGLLGILIFIPEIKKNLKIKKDTIKKLKQNNKYKKTNKQIAQFEKKLLQTEEKLDKMTKRIEDFYESTDKWLKNNTGGKHGLE